MPRPINRPTSFYLLSHFLCLPGYTFCSRNGYLCTIDNELNMYIDLNIFLFFFIVRVTPGFPGEVYISNNDIYV